MHFRTPRASQSDVVFSVNQEGLSYTTQYKYLGVVLTEHLEHEITAKIFAQVCKSRTRAFNCQIESVLWLSVWVHLLNYMNQLSAQLFPMVLQYGLPNRIIV